MNKAYGIVKGDDERKALKCKRVNNQASITIVNLTLNHTALLYPNINLTLKQTRVSIFKTFL